MFERFTTAARQAVVDAHRQAVRLHHSEIGAEHLLLALLAQPDTHGARVLASLGVDASAVRAQVPARDDLDKTALQTLGIDLAEVRHRVEAAFGPGSLDAERGRTGRFGRRRRLRRIPFTGAAREALENALREAVALGHRHIGTEHLVLGLLADEHGVARALLARAGARPTQEEARTAVRRELDAAA